MSAGCTIRIHAARERRGQIKNRIACSAIAVCVQSSNFQARGTQRRTGRSYRIARSYGTAGVSSNRQRVGIHARISEGRRISNVVALAFVGKKEKCFILLYRAANGRAEFAETNLLLLAG